MKKEKMVRISITISEKLLQKIDRICKKKGCTRSEFIRAAIRDCLGIK